MALRIRFQYQTGSNLGYSIERLSDGTLYDFSTSTFVASPQTTISALPEDAAPFKGRYKMTLSPTPAAQFSNGDYVVTVHDQNNADVVVAELATAVYNGDDSTVFPTASDPWATALPGSYAAGTAGAILGGPLTVGTVKDKSGYGLAASQTFSTTGSVGSVSGNVGGSVASVVAPVTAGTVSDKSGYSLASSGLDTITIETGINARQALSPILAASAGVVAGAGTGVVVIKGANTSTTRITANTDNAGNRSSVTLNLPT